MVIENKYTGLILLIITLISVMTLGIYNYSHMKDISVNATVISVEYESTPRNSNVNYYVRLKYNIDKNTYEGKLYIDSSSKYKVGDKIIIKVNPDNPKKIEDMSFNKYIYPFLAVILLIDVLYMKGKISKE